EREHVEAAIAAGATRPRVLTKHILPLCWSPIIVNATMDFGQVVLLAASLSFIGLGAVPPTPEWGQMISDGALHFYRWWIAAGPGIAILSIVLGFNSLGDGLPDFLDPRSKSPRRFSRYAISALPSRAAMAKRLRRSAASTLRSTRANCMASSANPARARA